MLRTSLLRGIKRCIIFCHGAGRGRWDDVWFIEDDVYFQSEQRLLAIDEAYPYCDLLTNGTTTRAEDMKSPWQWLWNKITIELPEPHWRAMACACRVSLRLLEAIANYVVNNGTLVFIEAMFPTMCRGYGMLHEMPVEMKTLEFRYEWTSDLIISANMYHPMKNIYEHRDLRDIERFI